MLAGHTPLEDFVDAVAAASGMERSIHCPPPPPPPLVLSGHAASLTPY